MGSFKELIIQNRSYRRFDASKAINKDELYDMIDTARLTASAANLQPLRYKIVNDKEGSVKVFSTLKWAGYLPEWDGPSESEQPAAYIILLFETALKKFAFDEGIAAHTITLSAAEKGYGCCILLNCNSKKLFSLLNIDDAKYTFSSVIAIGVPAENIILEEVKDGDIKYYRDNQGTHHVPKRPLSEVIIE